MVMTSDLHLGLGIVRGDVFSLSRTIANVPTNVTLTAAKLTLKASYSDVVPLFQKSITSTPVTDVGVIVNTGSDGIGEIRFDLTAANTLAMVADQPYFFDIEVTLSSGNVLTIERGTTSSLPEVTT